MDSIVFSREEVNSIEAYRDNSQKYAVKTLQKIRESKTGIKEPRECFCTKTRRKIWIKEFTEWYESVR